MQEKEGKSVFSLPIVFIEDIEGIGFDFGQALIVNVVIIVEQINVIVV